MRKIIIALVTLSIPSIYDATGQDSTLVDTTELLPQSIEVKGVRVGTRAPFSVTNINKQEIKAANVNTDIPYVLDQTPSVVVNSDAGTGIGYTDLRIRNTDMQRINFTINGVPVNDPESQGTFFVNFPDLLSSASSIQIQRGVGSSTNGVGAFGASIHINNITQSTQPYFSTIQSVGSYNTWRHSLMAGTGKLRSGFSFDVRMSKISSDGYIQRSYADLKSLHIIAGWASKDDNTRITYNHFTGRERTGQAWNGVSQDSLSTNRRYNELGLMENGAYYDDQSDNYQQDYHQLFINHRWNDRWSYQAAIFYTRGKGYYNEYRMSQSYDDYGLTSPVIGNDTISKTSLIRQLWLDNHYYGSILSTQYRHNHTEINAGLSYMQYDALHYGLVKWANIGIPSDHRWYYNPAKKSDINAYAKWEQQVYRNLYTYLDLQVRMVDYDINGFRKNPNIVSENKNTFFNPKVGATYLLGTNKFFVSYARAAKEPNRNDFEAGIVDKPRHEVLHDYEIGYERNDKWYNIGINLYWMQYRDQLIYTGKINDVGAYTRVNVPHSFRRGIELYGRYDITPALRWNASLTLSQNKIKEYTEYMDNYDLGTQEKITYRNTDIALSPGIIAASQIRYRMYSWYNGNAIELELNSKYIGRQYLDNAANANRSINPYHVHNLAINFALKPSWGKDISVKFIANNILNQMYSSKGYTYSYTTGGEVFTSNYFYPQAGRNYACVLSIDL